MGMVKSTFGLCYGCVCVSSIRVGDSSANVRFKALTVGD